MEIVKEESSAMKVLKLMEAEDRRSAPITPLGNLLAAVQLWIGVPTRALLLKVRWARDVKRLNSLSLLNIHRTIS